MITIRQTLTTLVALLLMGCTQEQFPENVPVNNGKSKEVIFSISIPGKPKPATRALDDNEENEVKSIEMLLFDPATKKVVGKPLFADAITSDPNNNGNFHEKSFSARLVEGTYDIMIFANARKAFNSVSIQAGDEQEETLAKLKASMPATGWVANPADAAKSYLIPMWGMKENIAVGEGITISGIYLHRMLSRIDLSVTGANEQTGDFKIKDIKLYNVQQEGRIAPALVNWDKNGLVNGVIGAGLAVAPSLTGGGVHAAPISYASVIAADQKSCVREMYIFEAPKATIHADQKAPFLTVKGEYNGVEGWYRIDLADYSNMNYLDVLRNYFYKIEIKKVSGTGFSDEEEAKKNRGDNIIVNVTPWNEHDLSGTVFNGQFFLSISPQDITLNEYAQKLRKIVIKTDNSSNITMGNIKVSGSASNPDAGLSGNWLSNLSISPKSVVDGKTVYTLTYDVAQNDGEPRLGYIYITHGRMTNVVRIKQIEKGTATVTKILIVPQFPKKPYKSWLSVNCFTSNGAPISNAPWTLTSNDPSWCRLSLDQNIPFDAAMRSISLNGSLDVCVIVKDNPGVYARTTTVSYTGAYPATPTFTQVIQLGDDAQPNVDDISFVGAFWRATETGERIIRLPGMYNNPANRGAWSVSVEWYDSQWAPKLGDGIVFSAEKLTAASLQSRGITWNKNTENPNTTANGPENHQVTEDSAAIRGFVDGNNPDIIFRIGLQKKFAKYNEFTKPARYAKVTIAYGTPLKARILYIRQGEGADIMSSGYQDVQFSPYNLGYSNTTAPAPFMTYPTQAGYFYQWRYSTHYLDYIPRPYPPMVDMPGNWMAAAGNAAGQTHNEYSLKNIAPYGYTLPSGGPPAWIVPQFASLYIVDVNFLIGYYADGFFDRRQIVDAPGVANRSESAVSTANDQIAYMGALCYNNETYQSLFFPFPGFRRYYDGLLMRAGVDGCYQSHSADAAYTAAWSFIFTSSAPIKRSLEATDKSRAHTIRCIRKIN